MTVETTLQDMYDNFPDLFSTRQECYNHLFCIVGNGYCWKWGQIVEDVYGLEENEKLHEDDYLHPKVLKAVQSIYNIKMKQDEDRELHELKRLNDLEDYNIDIGKYDPNKPHWSRISQYSLINEIPFNIKPDWKQAAIECFKILENDGVIDQFKNKCGDSIYKTRKALGIEERLY